MQYKVIEKQNEIKTTHMILKVVKVQIISNKEQVQD